MPKIKIHASNFDNIEMSITGGVIFIKSKWTQLAGDRVDPASVVALDVASEDSVKKIGGSLGWGVAGGVLMGPLGLIAGAILGGNRKDVTFIAELSEGRKFMATTDSKTYTELQAKSMRL